MVRITIEFFNRGIARHSSIIVYPFISYALLIFWKLKCATKKCTVLLANLPCSLVRWSLLTVCSCITENIARLKSIYMKRNCDILSACTHSDIQLCSNFYHEIRENSLRKRQRSFFFLPLSVLLVRSTMQMIHHARSYRGRVARLRYSIFRARVIDADGTLILSRVEASNTSSACISIFPTAVRGNDVRWRHRLFQGRY